VAGLNAKTRLDEPRPCPECGKDVWEVYGNLCDDCAAPVYRRFLEVMGMPVPDTLVTSD